MSEFLTGWASSAREARGRWKCPGGSRCSSGWATAKKNAVRRRTRARQRAGWRTRARAGTRAVPPPPTGEHPPVREAGADGAVVRGLFLECSSLCEFGVCRNRVFPDSGVLPRPPWIEIYEGLDDQGFSVRTLKPLSKGGKPGLDAKESG